MKRTILITGASSGIGREAAIALAQEDHHLVLAARRVELLEEVAAQARSLGATTTVVGIDLSQPGDGARAIEAIAQSEGYPVLVNNAGMITMKPFLDQTWDTLAGQLQVNLHAPIELCHQFVPIALARGGGQILNILSIVAEQTFAQTSAYTAAKAGLRAFGRVLAAEYRRKGLKVTAILPGATDTPIWAGAGWSPKAEDMIPPIAIATAIADVVRAPLTHNIEEITIMPTGGSL
ncbi:MAG: SDR family NAD(P)-dependent oxidoreductase [Fimbriimonas sp.]